MTYEAQFKVWGESNTRLSDGAEWTEEARRSGLVVHFFFGGLVGGYGGDYVLPLFFWMFFYVLPRHELSGLRISIVYDLIWLLRYYDRHVL